MKRRRTLATVVVLASLCCECAALAQSAPTPTPTAASTNATATALPVATGTQASVFPNFSVTDAQVAALDNSPDVVAARARVEQSRSQLQTAKSGLAPNLVSAYSQVPIGNPPGPNVTSRLASVGLEEIIGNFFTFKSSVEVAKLALAATQADENAAEATERIKTIGFYFDALKNRSIAAARQSALTLALAQRDAARKRFAAGDAPRLDVVRADVAVARATADLETATATDLNAREALLVETATTEANVATTALGPLPPPRALLTNPVAAVALARRLRPEIASAELTIAAAQASIGAARASGFPSLTVGTGYQGGTDSDVPIGSPTVTASLSIPLSSGVHDRVTLEKAKAAEARAKAAAIERTITLDVAAAARTLAAAERSATASTQARQSAAEELRATELGYRNGASSSLEVTSARATYAQAVVDELSAIYDVAKARATLSIEVGT